MSTGPGPPTPVVAVGAVAVVDGDLLLVRRAHEPGQGRWTIPGGRMEPGESVTAAVEREVLEETAIVVRCGALVGWAERRGPDHHFVILDFEVAPTGGRDAMAGDDATAAEWVPLDQVPSRPLVDGLEEFLVAHGVLS